MTELKIKTNQLTPEWIAELPWLVLGKHAGLRMEHGLVPKNDVHVPLRAGRWKLNCGMRFDDGADEWAVVVHSAAPKTPKKHLRLRVSRKRKTGVVDMRLDVHPDEWRTSCCNRVPSWMARVLDCTVDSDPSFVGIFGHPDDVPSMNHELYVRRGNVVYPADAMRYAMDAGCWYSSNEPSWTRMYRSYRRGERLTVDHRITFDDVRRLSALYVGGAHAWELSDCPTCYAIGKSSTNWVVPGNFDFVEHLMEHLEHGEAHPFRVQDVFNHMEHTHSTMPVPCESEYIYKA